MATNDINLPPPCVEILPQNLAPSSPLDRVLREFGVNDAAGIETGRIMGVVDSNVAEVTAQAEGLAANPAYYARLVATSLEITVTEEESTALVAAGATVLLRQLKV